MTKWNDENQCWEIMLCNGMIFQSKTYHKVFFWKKYARDIDHQFIADYVNNR